MRAKRSRPSTPHQPSRCSHKTCSAAPPTRPPTTAQRPTPGQEAVERRPNPGAPQPIGHPHPRTAHPSSNPTRGPIPSPDLRPQMGNSEREKRWGRGCARHPYPCQKQPRKATLRGPQKAREPTEPKPIRKPRPIHPETNPGQPAHSGHADPSKPPPPDRKGTSVSNRNQDKEPETEPEPPKTKQRPQPSKANHPSPPQKETYTHPNIRTTPRAHKTLDSQADTAPPPPADPPPRQQNVLLEGRSTCNEMGPTCQFRRPLCLPIHQRSPSQGRSPGMHQPKTPATYPPGPKTPKAQPGLETGSDTPQGPRAPSPPQTHPGAARAPGQ
ncbi:extensin-like [Girardinichthys multiradiatus]|uniref:extensin-like n=1 Tax=Girardinichthys multiradiatus TaxID=208333 RepID=UPI001FAE2BF8|nr:extensin-like [Girardinichthys multiradiatus]